MCIANLVASLRLFACDWGVGTKVRLVVDATALTRCVTVTADGNREQVGDLSPQPPTDAEIASALDGGAAFFAFAGERDLASAAHAVLIVSAEHSTVVPFCVIPALSGSRTASVKAEVEKAGQLVASLGLVVDGIVTDGDRSDIREDLTTPCLAMVSVLDRTRKNCGPIPDLEAPAFQQMNLAMGGPKRWTHRYDLFHTLNNLRVALANRDRPRLLMWPPIEELDVPVAGVRTERVWRPGRARHGTQVKEMHLRACGICEIYFTTTAYDSMDRGKTLEEFGGFHFRLIFEAWAEGRIGGVHLLVWTLAYLMVSVRTLDLRRGESIRRWTWVWALTTVIAGAWQRTVKRRGGKYQGDPLFGRDLLHKFIHIAALHVVEALENKVMNLEAGDTRRLEHLFAEIKNIAPDRGVSGFLKAWGKTPVIRSQQAGDAIRTTKQRKGA
jgi:hypothetical protein